MKASVIRKCESVISAVLVADDLKKSLFKTAYNAKLR